jgi:hypothetical protein
VQRMRTMIGTAIKKMIGIRRRWGSR